MPWQQLTITTNQHDAPQFEQLLEDFGALSITLSDAADQAIYELSLNTTPLWQHVCVTGLFEEAHDLSSIKPYLAAHVNDTNDWEISLAILKDQVWERVWLKDFQPIKFGKNFWVCSSEHKVCEQDAILLRLDPGLAFGTGTHPTTALCLEWLSQQALHKKNIIDFGCGSGILAIAALLLGAERATCIDIDPQALSATIDNAKKNHVLQKIGTFNADNYPAQPQDIIIANILAEPLISLSQKISSLVKPSGQLVLSGILDEQVDDVKQAYKGQFKFEPTLRRQGWACLRAHKTSL